MDTGIAPTGRHQLTKEVSVCGVMAQGGALIQSEDQEENTHQGRGGGGLEPACCTELDRLHLFEAQAPALPFAFPLWPGLLRSPPYHHHHRSLLPCHRAPPGAPGQGEGNMGSHMTAQTASARAGPRPAKLGAEPPLRWVQELCLPCGASSWQWGCTSTARARDGQERLWAGDCAP